MNIDTKDYLLVVIGFVLNLVASAVYSGWVVRTKKSEASWKAEEQLWSERITSIDINDRTDAFFEIIIRSSY